MGCLFRGLAERTRGREMNNSIFLLLLLLPLLVFILFCVSFSFFTPSGELASFIHAATAYATAYAATGGLSYLGLHVKAKKCQPASQPSTRLPPSVSLLSVFCSIFDFLHVLRTASRSTVFFVLVTYYCCSWLASPLLSLFFCFNSLVYFFLSSLSYRKRRRQQPPSPSLSLSRHTPASQVS